LLSLSSCVEYKKHCEKTKKTTTSGTSRRLFHWPAKPEFRVLHSSARCGANDHGSDTRPRLRPSSTTLRLGSQGWGRCCHVSPPQHLCLPPLVRRKQKPCLFSSNRKVWTNAHERTRFSPLVDVSTAHLKPLKTTLVRGDP